MDFVCRVVEMNWRLTRNIKVERLVDKKVVIYDNKKVDIYSFIRTRQWHAAEDNPRAVAQTGIFDRPYGKGASKEYPVR